jgi:tetratricopeptide (TPR) repeat protein
MNRMRGIILALAAGLVASCATAGGGASGGSAGGIKPSDNGQTRAASLYLARAVSAPDSTAQDLYQKALDAATQAQQDNPQNPKAYYLMGQAQAGLGAYVAADSLFTKAEDMYPGYKDEIQGEREQAWILAYNQGVAAVNAGNIEKAGELFADANMLYQGRPEALMNLAWVDLQNNNNDKAIDAYRQALTIMQSSKRDSLDEKQLASWKDSEQLATNNMSQLLAQEGKFDEAAQVLENFLQYNPDNLNAKVSLAEMYTRAGKKDSAQVIYDSLLTRQDLGFNEYFQIGIGFFNSESFKRAADAFRTATKLNPYSRDSWYNLVQALYSEAQAIEKDSTQAADTAAMNQKLAPMYKELIDASNKVLQFDPYNRNIMTFMARADRGLADASPKADATQYQKAVNDVLRRYQSTPIEVMDVSTRGDMNNPPVQVSGTIQNVNLDEGSNIQLRFSLLGQDGSSVGSTIINVAAPAKGKQQTFSGSIQPTGKVGGWKYELVQQ